MLVINTTMPQKALDTSSVVNDTINTLQNTKSAGLCPKWHTYVATTKAQLAISYYLQFQIYSTLLKVS